MMNLTKKNKDIRPLILIVMDGWGYSEKIEHNAILAANTPNWDKLWASYPHTLIGGSGTDVGLPADQMGNSEVGHLTMGSGRIIHQEYTRIDNAIADGSFFKNEVITHAVDNAKNNGKAVHVLGLLSPGGVHAHEHQIHAMLKLAVERGAADVYLHAFLDGRDCPPKSARDSIIAVENLFDSLGHGRIASMIGRYYAMDRDHRWDRTKAAYDLITQSKAEFQAKSALDGLDMAYNRGESDEFVKATTIVPTGGKAIHVEEGDVVIFMNFRADRARQLTQIFTEKEFREIDKEHSPELDTFVCLTGYKKGYRAPVAFPPARPKNVFGEYISNRGLKQLRIAETEKYAHVTFFFNGGEERAFENEDRILIKSPDIATYDLQPEMNAPEVTDNIVNAIKANTYDVIICNYANPDMVGHTGKFDAVVAAIEALDQCLGRLYDAISEAGGEMLVTADHGNAEKMHNPESGQPHTAHTTNSIPFMYIGRPATASSSGGSLADIAPTMLYLLGLDIPEEMDGRSLIELTERQRKTG
ncbi:MAG: 2,3-bisphosphoglycerate-independent phosphoglycerate mutase [Gammaproteobacteria bacterium]